MADGFLDPASGEVITPRQAENSEIKRQEPAMQVVENLEDEHKPSQKSLPSFKLDLSKCHTETDIGEVAIDIDTGIQLKSSTRNNTTQQQQTPKKESEARQEKQ